MKHIILLFLLTFTFISCNDFSDLPEPNLIPFEKQEVLSSYDFRLIEPTGKTLNIYANQNKVI